MYADPTIDDFAAWIDFHLQKALKRAGQEVSKVESRAVGAGAYHSGRTILLVFEAVHQEFDHGVDAALGELKRATRITNLDKAALRKVAEEKLRAFAVAMKGASKAEKMRSWAGRAGTTIDERLAELDTKLGFALRQFDVGFLDPLEPEVPLSMTNSINIGTMSGGAIQQGSPHATQNVSVTFNIETARRALTELEKAIMAAPIPPEAIANMRPDLDTIKAQLDKKTPSESIVKEAGRSLRSIIEGVAAGALTPPVMAAASSLWVALGLG